MTIQVDKLVQNDFFYKAQGMQLGNRKVEVSNPAIVMLQKTATGSKLTVSDPTQKLVSMVVTVDGVPHTIIFSTSRVK